MCQDPNCIYCEPCKCGHQADEHMAGEGQCFICKCKWFESQGTPKTQNREEMEEEK